MSYGNKSIGIIDNSIFLDRNDCLGSEFGRFDTHLGKPNDADPLHLGSKGIRLLCSNIKRCVMRKNNNQSVERFNGGGGIYNAAAHRATGQRDGYQVRAPW